MELEQLTKSQTVLLTLLVSFVTSIATGIVTVSLLDQAPPAITQSINRVVERTIETVAPEKTQNASVITKETTVVVKDEDLITSSIAKNLGSLVKLRQGTTTNQILGIGVVVGKDGVVATDRSIVAEEGTYLVEVAGGAVYEAKVDATDAPYGLSFLIPTDPKTVPSLAPVKLGSLTNAKLGQTVLALGSSSRANVSLGIISSVDTLGGSADSPQLSFITASLSGKEPALGTPLLNIFGEVIGIATSLSKKNADSSYVPGDRVAIYLTAHAAPVAVTPATVPAN